MRSELRACRVQAGGVKERALANAIASLNAQIRNMRGILAHNDLGHFARCFRYGRTPPAAGEVSPVPAGSQRAPRTCLTQGTYRPVPPVAGFGALAPYDCETRSGTPLLRVSGAEPSR